MALPVIPTMPTTLTGLLILIVGLIILWVAVSIPVYFAGKIIKGWKASFGDAMVATFGGELAYFLIFYLISILLGPVIGATATAIGFILAIVAWLAVYRGAFNTGWLGALGIVIVAWIVLHIIDFILIMLFGVAFPNFIPF
jgi:hypothetical protein